MNNSKNHPIRYFLVRHGKSLANEADVIVSHIENGVDPKWGLSPKGIEQAKAAGYVIKPIFGILFSLYIPQISPFTLLPTPPFSPSHTHNSIQSTAGNTAIRRKHRHISSTYLHLPIL